MNGKVTEADRIARSAFYRWFLMKCDETVHFLKNPRYTDEVHFYLDGRINPKTIGYGARHHQTWSKRTSCTQRSALRGARCGSGIIGTSWMEDDAGEAVTVQQIAIARP